MTGPVFAHKRLVGIAFSWFELAAFSVSRNISATSLDRVLKMKNVGYFRVFVGKNPLHSHFNADKEQRGNTVSLLQMFRTQQATWRVSAGVFTSGCVTALLL